MAAEKWSNIFSRFAVAAPLALALVGCSSLSKPTERVEAAPAARTEVAVTTPGKHALRKSQYVFYSDFALPENEPLLNELGRLRDQIYRELQLPPAENVVQVFIFEDRDRYERYMRSRYPELPRRRAFFVAQPRGHGGGDELLVYTFNGEHIRQDLRHELTHALLHSVLKDVPLWLDEGLAEFFELPPEADGLNRQHLATLREGQFSPNLSRLEALTQVDQMKPPEYREAWAWVHLMLRGKPEGRQALLAYLHQLRSTPTPGPLEPRLRSSSPALDGELAQHLTQLGQRTSVARGSRE